MSNARPHITVAVVVERDGRFLLVREQADGRTVLNQPAGHLEVGESLSQAACREALEETAWRIEIEALLGIYRYTSSQNGICYVRHCFIARAVEDTGAALDTGILEACWLSRAELAAAGDQLRSPMVLQVIDDYLAGQRYPLAVITESSP